MKLILVNDQGNVQIMDNIKFFKTWTEEDIADAIEDHNVYPSYHNMKALLDSNLLKYLEEKFSDSDAEIIDEAIKACKEDHVFTDKGVDDPAHPNLLSLMRYDQKLLNYCIADDLYTEYSLIMDQDADASRADIAGLLEETLHMLKDAGASDSQIRYLTGMSNERGMYEEGQSIDIDLGYFLPAGIYDIYEG